ncbi:MAG: NnrS family protein [Polaromonas sp.]
MSKVIKLNEAAAATTAGAPSLKASLELGFRPLYPAGALWAAVAIALWIFAPQTLTGTLQGVAWHAHEMLWGFIATIAVGFLLTAGANWTGRNPIRGAPLAALLGLWVLARVGFLVPGTGAFRVAAVSELLFFAVAAIALALAIVGSRNTRNYGVPVMVLALGAADAWYLWLAAHGNYIELMQAMDSGLLVMAAIALLVARRVIPFFAVRVIPGLELPKQTRSGQIQLAACVAALACLLAGLRQPLAGFLVLAGITSLYQLLSWKPLRVRQKPLLWILYAGYAALGCGLIAAAVHVLSPGIRAAVHVHVIAMGGFSVLIIGMLTRTALGHLGRPLKLDRSMQASYWLMLLAVVLRLCALAPSNHAGLLLQMAALAWMAVFALYLWRFFPLMIRPRADAR